MQTILKNHSSVVFLAIIAILAVTSCAPQIELSSSWTNKQAQVKTSPEIMVMVLGKDLQNRQTLESYIVYDLINQGYKAIAALDILRPDVQYDSTSMVNLLREHKIDMLLTNAIVDITEKEHYVPGTTTQVPVGTYATPYNPYYSENYYYYGGQNNYYGYYSNYTYRTAYETQTTPGHTYIEVEVIVESKLYDVNKPELLWFGQSKSSTKEPSKELFETFSKLVVGDMVKNNVLVK